MSKSPTLQELIDAPLRNPNRSAFALPTKRTKKDAAHAAPPGTGPEGETCKSCLHIYRNRLSKVYLKCDLMRAHWTGGGGTDIRAKDPACSKWERGE